MCKKHRGYQAIRRPRTACEPCWRMYIEKHPVEDKPLIREEEYWISPKTSKIKWILTKNGMVIS